MTRRKADGGRDLQPECQDDGEWRALRLRCGQEDQSPQAAHC